MARPQHSLTALAATKPEQAIRQIRSAMRDANFEYVAAAAVLGMSQFRLRRLCKELSLSEEILKGRMRVGGDRRGRPAIPTPPVKILKRILEDAAGNLNEAARKLNVAAPTVARWVEELGLSV